jgi:hypothetical protein
MMFPFSEPICPDSLLFVPVNCIFQPANIKKEKTREKEKRKGKAMDARKKGIAKIKTLLPTS